MFTATRSTTETVAKAASRFARSKSGSVAMMTGLLFPTLLLLAGGATDIGRAYALKSKAQSTMDAAVLSVARSKMTDQEIEEKGEDILEGWFATRDMAGVLENVEFVSRKEGNGAGEPSAVTATATLNTKPYFLHIFGKDSLDIGLRSSTLKPNPLPYEISLVLDVSGSMNQSLNGSPRIERLKESVGALLDLVESQSQEGQPPTVSVVPYSTSVNIGGLGLGILEGASVSGKQTPDGGDDVWAAERFRSDDGAGFDLTEDAPFQSSIPFVTAEEIDHSSPVVRVQQPTDDPSVYRAAVDGLVADGWTAAHLGMIWGMYALSPEWASVWNTDPRPYGEAQKAIVILTDGEFNTTHNIGARSTMDGDESNRYFQSACDLASNRGVAVYAVALSLDAVSEARLNTCATKTGGRMFSADSADSLTKAFEDIAAELGGLRLSS